MHSTKKFANADCLTTRNQLLQARETGAVKESTCANALSWLEPSFARVEVEGAIVGGFISELVQGQRWEELDDRFFKMNSFGTAGVRGKMAIGTAHFNRIILGLGVEAHARYITEAFSSNGRLLAREKAVVLAYDSRRGSCDPATGGAGFLVKEAASVYAAHGIKVYLFDSVAPTPELSFAIGECEDIRPYAGGVFTASHNPATDNGFKPYDYYGGQIVHRGVQDLANGITEYGEVRSMDFHEAVRLELIQVVGPEVDRAYIEKENQTAIWVDREGRFLKDKISDSLRLVFSSLNGTAQRLMSRVLERRGVDVQNNLIEVAAQCVPNGAFPSCPRPNPEEKAALEESIKLAARTRADLLVATDPDSDRLGIGVRLSEEETARYDGEEAVRDGYYLLNGNQQLVLLTDYILSQLKARDGALPNNSLISKSLVSTDLAREIADAYGVMTVEPQVGFKFVGEKLELYARAAVEASSRACGGGSGDYRSLSRVERVALLQEHAFCVLFGGEESYGSLIGDFVKDKDAVTVTAMFVEIAGFLKQQGRTLTQRLEEIYQTYGYSKEETISLSFEGAAGNDVIRAIMAELRAEPLQEIAGRRVIASIDYRRSLADGRRAAKDADGNVLFDDSEPEGESHTGYMDVAGVRVPMFWHCDYRVIGPKAQLPEADVVMYIVDGGSKVIVRPSGTEPKIKFYVLAKGARGGGKEAAGGRREANEFFAGAREELTGMAGRIRASLP